MNFHIIPQTEIEQVKIAYFNEFWELFVFELEDSQFLYEYGEWSILEKPPLKIGTFINALNLLIERLNVEKMKIVICSFAEKGKTNNMIVEASGDELLEKLFLMCENSFVCPDNLIIDYVKDNR